MPPTADELVTMIGSPPTATGIAAAILACTNPAPAAVTDPPDDHGLHPDDPAVTGVPRDETVPTPGVDLPATDTSPVPVETLPGSGDATPPAGAGDDTVPAPQVSQTPEQVAEGGSDGPTDIEAPAPVDPLDDEIAADEADVAADETKLADDQARLGKDKAARAAEGA